MGSVGMSGGLELAQSFNWAVRNSTGQFDGKVCEEFHDFNRTDWCDFYEAVESCELEETFVEYVEVVLCSENIESDAFFIGKEMSFDFQRIVVVFKE